MPDKSLENTKDRYVKERCDEKCAVRYLYTDVCPRPIGLRLYEHCYAKCLKKLKDKAGASSPIEAPVPRHS